jgi:hypothetical protein
MQAPAACCLFSMMVLIGTTLAVLTLDIVRGPHYYQDIEVRQIEGRATITSVLHNNVSRGSYYVEVDVGTPAQRQTLFLDTGSSDTWILDSRADLCVTPRLQQRRYGGCGTTCK